uniref:Myb/SANT-like DNA-binding domain-containing protein n=1 Tax=Gopherus agassizii TaxID=38772 RepID=A0A452GGC1_9SAUR
TAVWWFGGGKLLEVGRKQKRRVIDHCKHGALFFVYFFGPQKVSRNSHAAALVSSLNSTALQPTHSSALQAVGILNSISCLLASQVSLTGYRTKHAPAQTTAELLDLINIWGEESLQSQLQVTHRNQDTYGQISQGLCKKGYDRDTQQCSVKIKELRQAYHKVREANHCSGGAPKTCRFYKELNAILGGDPISIADSPVDTSEAAERGVTQRLKFQMKKWSSQLDRPVGRQPGTFLHSRSALRGAGEMSR